MLSKNVNQNVLTIVVNTCDSYSDVLGIFFCALKNYWPDCPYSVVINAERQNYNYPARVHNYVALNGVDDWGQRLLSTLENIDSEYVLMLYDDFILNGAVSTGRVAEALNGLDSQANAVVAYLINTSLPLRDVGENNMFLEVEDRVDYKLNSAPAIWNRRALINYTAPGDTPWAWEVFGTYRTWGDGNLFFSLNPEQVDIYPYNYAKGGAIYRGKWVREVVEEVSRVYPLDIDWSRRGFSSDTEFEKRSFLWKIRFMQTGFRMVGVKALNFLIGYIRIKCHAG